MNKNNSMLQQGNGTLLHKPSMTWFLIADAESAQIYIRERVKVRIPMAGNSKQRHYEEKMETEVTPLKGKQWKAETPDQYDYTNSSLGRVFKSASSKRSAMEPPTDIRDVLSTRFMRRLADELSKAHHEKAFERLILIAPPKLLGELKKQLDKNIMDCVVAELPKELTHYEGRALAAQLESIP